MTKITIERETLERAIDYLDRRLNWNLVVENLCNELRAALAAQPADAQPEPVACEHKRARWNITFTSGTCMDCESTWLASKGWAAPPAPAAVPLTGEQWLAAVNKEFDRRGDAEGQGLHPYWKQAFRDGCEFARAHGIAAGNLK